MREGESPQDVIQAVYDREPILDQWQAQILAGILKRADVAVYSRMESSLVRDCKLSVIEDLEGVLREKIAEAGGDARVAVLPDGPLTIRRWSGRAGSCRSGITYLLKKAPRLRCTSRGTEFSDEPTPKRPCPTTFPMGP